MDFPKIKEDVFYYLSVKASKMGISGEGEDRNFWPKYFTKELTAIAVNC